MNHDCLSGKCRGKCVGLGVGNACTVDGMCKSNICNTLGRRKVCVLKAPGEHCYKGSQCSSNTCIGNTCECTAPCVFGPDCRIGCPAHQRCVFLDASANYCGDKIALDKACEFNAQCATGVCRRHKCSVKPPGEYCTRDAECGSTCLHEECQCQDHPQCTFGEHCLAGCRAGETCIASSNAKYCRHKPQVTEPQVYVSDTQPASQTEI